MVIITLTLFFQTTLQNVVFWGHEWYHHTQRELSCKELSETEMSSIWTEAVFTNNPAIDTVKLGHFTHSQNSFFSINKKSSILEVKKRYVREVGYLTFILKPGQKFSINYTFLFKRLK